MKEESNFVIGIHPTLEAISAGKTIDRVLMQSGLRGEATKKLEQILREHQIPMQYVPLQKMQRVTRKNHQGVIAFISPVEFQSIEQIVPGLFESGKTPLLLVLDGLTDVRNFGAITRTAECNGVDAIIVPEKGFAQINEGAVKSSAGALLTAKICRVSNLVKTLKYLKNSGIQLIACTEKASDYLSQADFSMPSCLVMGGEEKGISMEILRLADVSCKIPMFGDIQSLNVSVACGVALYEANRQRFPRE